MRFIDDHTSDEIAMGEPLQIELPREASRTPPIASSTTKVDRVEVLYVLGLC